MKGLRANTRSSIACGSGGGEWRWIISRGRVTERDATGALRMIGTNVDITRAPSHGGGDPVRRADRCATGWPTARCSTSA